MLPPAPPRLSMMNVCFISSVSALAMGRAAMSEGPPGGHGTMIVTGLVGYACASAIAGNAAGRAALASATRNRNKRDMEGSFVNRVRESDNNADPALPPVDVLPGSGLDCGRLV